MKSRVSEGYVSSVQKLRIFLNCAFCVAIGACTSSQTVVATVSEKVPTLLVSQSNFGRTTGPDGKPMIQPQPAQLSLWRHRAEGWSEERITDPESNVFHKAIPFQAGILTLAGEAAKIKHWTQSEGGWTSKEIWSKDWGGKFNRMRDLELLDIDGDGTLEMIVATHDQGVIGVGRLSDEVWSFEELGQKPDTFVHEIEVGDVDGDGKSEIYGTPSERNRGDLSSQQGGVIRYDFSDGAFVPTWVAQWPDTHAKEITVLKGRTAEADQLFAVKEATSTMPVDIVRLSVEGGIWTERSVAKLKGEKQARFLVVGDPDGDGALEMVVAGKNTGLWLLEAQEDGTYRPSIIDATSGGFEQATHMADLDGDGVQEVYVASERPGQKRELRQYKWDGQRFRRYVIAEMKGMGITWHVYDGSF